MKKRQLNTNNKLYNILLPIKKISKLFVYFFLISLLLLMIINFSISWLASKYIYSDINKIPYKPYAILLGTAKFYAKTNKPNKFYQARIIAANELYQQQKYSFLLLSGDNRSVYYNEPMMMYKDLLAKGVNKDIMLFDSAGFNTLDSIVRAQKVFNISKMLIISQRFHCERAILIAKVNNIDAVCYAAKTPSHHYSVKIREYFARVKLLTDLYITKRQPALFSDTQNLLLQ